MWFGFVKGRGFSPFFLALVLSWVSLSFAETLQLSWQSNKEPDLAGYRIHFGTQSRKYDKNVDVGKNTSHVLNDLAANVEYFFSVTAYDTAANESGFSSEVSCVLGDQIAPTIVSVTPITATELVVLFSEVVEATSAQTQSNYLIDQNITVDKAVLEPDRKTVRLITSKHQLGVNYRLQVKNITDIALPANKIADNTAVSYSLSVQDNDSTPPTIQLATLANATELRIHFSEPVESASATLVTNYQIDPNMKITSAEMITDNSVKLVTSPHIANTNYLLTVRGVRDASKNRNEIAANTTYAYNYAPGDVLGPMITLVSAPQKDRVTIMFNEPLDKTSAETVANYQIDGGVTIQAASLDQTQQIVTLQTAAHTAGRVYTLTINNVQDKSVNKNPIAANTKSTYIYQPPDQTAPTIARVDVIDDSHLRIHFSETMEQSSVENAANYKIDNSIIVLSVKLENSGQSAEAITTPHAAGKVYTLTINGVRDASEAHNVIAANSTYSYTVKSGSDNTGPTIVEAIAENATTVKIKFNKSLERNSAQNPANFRINRNVVVNSAQLLDDKITVKLLTTAHEGSQIHIVTVNGVTDDSPQKNSILPNSSYAYLYEGEDKIGPIITLVRVIDAENLDVLFNEPLHETEAEKLGNFSINDGQVTIKEAQLQSSRRIVHLKTDSHIANKLYVLKVNNLCDDSPSQNKILPNSSYSYVYEPPDQVSPSIAMVRVKDSGLLEVAFTEPVEVTSASNKANYQLNQGITVQSVRMGTASHLVEVAISPLSPGKIYILMVNNVKDPVGNKIPYNSSYTFVYGDITHSSGPGVVGVSVVSATELRVSFDTKLTKSSAEQPGNYVIQGGLKVTKAMLDTSLKVVRLQTDSHEINKIYVLLVSNIARNDNPSLIIRPNTPFFYLFEDTGGVQPTVNRVVVLGEKLVEVTFTRPVDRLSAENRFNYQISPDIAVLRAELDNSETRVILETSRHRVGIAFTMTISGVRGRGAGNELIITSASFAYTYLPALQIMIDGYAETNMSHLEVGKPYYIDRNYVVTHVPRELTKSKMIMTSNNDRENTSTRYLTLQLTEAAFVYIAYDSRALSVPYWLSSKFTKTGLNVGVSENAENLNVWAGYFPAGKVVLGGNLASGAQNGRSMYIIMIQEAALNQQPGNGQLEGNWTHNKSLPESVMLHPNYPNPFNPSTTIAIELPIENQVRLIIYDILGRVVKVLTDQTLSPGRHNFVWDGTNSDGIPVAAGLYFYRMEAWEVGERNGLTFRENHTTFIRKMTFLK